MSNTNAGKFKIVITEWTPKDPNNNSWAGEHTLYQQSFTELDLAKIVTFLNSPVTSNTAKLSKEIK